MNRVALSRVARPLAHSSNYTERVSRRAPLNVSLISSFSGRRELLRASQNILTLSTTKHRGRHAGIIATVGPACEHNLAMLYGQGTDVFRVNCSHGTFESQQARVRSIHQIPFEDASLAPKVLIDLPNAKVRLAEFPEGELSVVKDQEVSFVINKEKPEAKTSEGIVLSFDHSAIYSDLVDAARKQVEGQKMVIRIGDGPDAELEVIEITKDKIRTRCLEDGVIKSRKGVNITNVDFHVPNINERDRWAIKLALQEKADLIAISFVQGVDDINDIENEIIRQAHQLGIRDWNIGFVVKIETPAAVRHYRDTGKDGEPVEVFPELEKIMNHPRVKGVMIATGDLALTIGKRYGLPFYMEAISEYAKQHGMFLIMATGVLESMKTQSDASRNDSVRVRQALKTHCDAIMLSDETANAPFWMKAVSVLHRLILDNQRYNEILEGFMQDPNVDRVVEQLISWNPEMLANLYNAAVHHNPRIGREHRKRWREMQRLDFEERKDFARSTLLKLKNARYPVALMLDGMHPRRAARLLQLFSENPQQVIPVISELSPVRRYILSKFYTDTNFLIAIDRFSHPLSLPADQEEVIAGLMFRNLFPRVDPIEILPFFYDWNHERANALIKLILESPTDDSRKKTREQFGRVLLQAFNEQYAAGRSIYAITDPIKESLRNHPAFAGLLLDYLGSLREGRIHGDTLVSFLA